MTLEKLYQLQLTQITEGIKELFAEKGIDIAGKKVLDVGCSKGFHAHAMREMGADVSVNDMEIGKLLMDFPEDKKIPGLIEDLPISQRGRYDIVTAFRVFPTNTSAKEVKDYYHNMARALKPGGKVIIGIDKAVDMLVHKAIIEDVFKSSSVLYEGHEDKKNIIKDSNQLLLMASEPRYVSVLPRNKF